MTSRPQLQWLPADAPAQEIDDCLRAHGAVVIEHLIAAPVLEQMVGEVAPHVEAADPAMRHVSPVLAAFFGDRTRHVASLAGKSRTFATEVMTNAVLMGVCDSFLLPSCARYQLNLGHLIVRGPGSEPQPFHRDEANWTSYMPTPHPEILVSSMTALVDFTEANGATMVVPGSHRWPPDRVAEEAEVVHAELSAGSTLVYLGSVLHAAGRNTTDAAWRLGLHLSYTLGWLRTEENNFLGCPLEVVRTLPRDAQELLGYAIHDSLGRGGGYLGMVELKTPMELLESAPGP